MPRVGIISKYICNIENIKKREVNVKYFEVIFSSFHVWEEQKKGKLEKRNKPNISNNKKWFFDWKKLEGKKIARSSRDTKSSVRNYFSLNFQKNLEKVEMIVWLFLKYERIKKIINFILKDWKFKDCLFWPIKAWEKKRKEGKEILNFFQSFAMNSLN